MKITIALLQMAACGDDQAANLAKGEEFCRRARAIGADIALFPEMWNIGYTSFAPDTDGIEDDIWKAPALWPQTSTPITSPDLEQARLRWQAQAIKKDAPFIQHFQGLARELQMAIALTYLEQWSTALGVVTDGSWLVRELLKRELTRRVFNSPALFYAL